MAETPREIVEIARKINRSLMIGKGMFFDADALAMLASIGVNELIQAKAAERLREECERRAAAKRERDAETVDERAAWPVHDEPAA